MTKKKMKKWEITTHLSAWLKIERVTSWPVVHAQNKDFPLKLEYIRKQGHRYEPYHYRSQIAWFLTKPTPSFAKKPNFFVASRRNRDEFSHKMRAKSDIDPWVSLNTEIRKRLLKKGGIWSCKMLVYPVLGFYLLPMSSGLRPKSHLSRSTSWMSFNNLGFHWVFLIWSRVEGEETLIAACFLRFPHLPFC